MSRLFLRFGGACAFGVALLVACVGDDPGSGDGSSTSSSGGASSGTTSSGGSSSGASTSSGTTACAGDTVDACGASCTKCTAPTGGTVECVSGACQPKCPMGSTLCGTTCTDLQLTTTDCGKCGHACNGAACTAGVCGTVEIAKDFTSVEAIAAGPSSMGVVMIVNGTDVKRCGIATGCTAATLSDIQAGGYALHHLAVAGSEVFWDTDPSDPWIVYHCPVSGCPGGGPTQAESNNDRFGALVAGPNDVYWTIAGYCSPYSHKCTPPACSTFTEVRTYTSSCANAYDSPQVPSHETTIPTSIASVGASTVVWATGGLYNDSTKFLRSCPLTGTCTPTEINTNNANVQALSYFSGKHYGAAAGTIFSVADTAGTATTTNLVSDATGITGIAVDASGIYWVNGTSGNVRRCAKLAGCASGEVETLATGQIGATAIAIDTNNVYWALPTKVMRVVK